MAKQLKIAFLPASNNGLSFRGSETSMYAYMHYLEKLLGHRSILCLARDAVNDPSAFKLFQDRFPDIVYFTNEDDLDAKLVNLKVDAMYSIRSSPDADFILKHIPMLIHCVYNALPSRGLVCASVSPSITNASDLVVPHIVSLAESTDDYREFLHIPKEAIVFGRHGGIDTFDLDIAKRAILRILATRCEVYFLFAVRPNILWDVSHPRLICLEAFSDPIVKRKFINTFDAFLHAQSLGETFGLSCAESSMVNKPVITWNGGRWREHLRILKDKCIRYANEDELYSILMKFNPIESKTRNWNAYGDYTPERVMRMFETVFLKPLISSE